MSLFSRFPFSPLAFAVGLSSSLLACAVQADAFDNLVDSPTLTGDWGGSRSRLEASGVKLTGEYVSETMGLVSGGLKHGARYAQQVRLGATFDLETLLDEADAGTVQLTINDRRGHSASQDLVGNRLPVQEIYGGLYTRLSELSYARSLFTDDLNVKLGWMAMGNDFGGMGILTNFVNAGFCAHPLSMSGGSGWGNYPTAHWGMELKYRISPEWTVQTAWFNVNPETNSASSKAFDLTSSGTTGAILPVELIYNNLATYDGQYKFGWYYDTSDTARIGQPDSKAAGRHGAYVLVDQMVWRSDSTRGRSVRLFAQATDTDTATSPFSHWYAAGAVLSRPCASREHDNVGLAYGRAVFNSRSRDVQIANLERGGDLAQAQSVSNLDMGEQLVELSYTAQVTRWLTVRPSVQYVMEPGAFSGKDTQDALLAGVQVKVQF